MQKIFSKILMSVILVGIFMLPLSASFEKKNTNLAWQIRINEVQATGPVYSAAGEDTVPSGLDLNCKILAGAGQMIYNYFSMYGTLYKTTTMTNLKGCIAEVAFALWQASAWVARGAGAFLDYFVYYSINSESFNNDFIARGWGIVRDITNVFFIIALLYVAIKTILSMNVSDNKRLVGTIIIIALLINFSLFATEVVIDASNVIAKIFYNGIAPSNSNGEKGKVNAGGEKSISVAMVAKYNPQQVLNMTQIQYDAEGGTAIFIFVTLVLLALTLYTAYIFFTVAVIFLSRVIALWLAMIFSAFAFASYTVPFKIPGFGHEDWWPELFKNAFLAPIFIFFLYLIVMFLDIGIFIPYEDTSSTLARVMSALIPFAALYILLTQAKKIAVKMSGEIGAGVMGAAKSAALLTGGIVGGAALGAAAVGGRAVFGRLGSMMANSSTLKGMESRGEFGGKALRSLGKAASTGSFDLRQVKIKGKGLSSLTGADLGEGKKGGFEQRKKEKTEKRLKRAKDLEVGEDEELKQRVRLAEGNLEALKNDPIRQNALVRLKGGDPNAAADDPASLGLGTLERNVTTAERAVADAERELKDTIALHGAQDPLATAARAVQAAAITHRNTERGYLETRQQAIRTQEGPLHHAEDALRTAENNVIGENRIRRLNFATTIQDDFNQTINLITSGGVHSSLGDREAANKIRAGIKSEDHTPSHASH